MPSTINLLSDADSLVRFIDNSTFQQTPRYLNGNGTPVYNWTATNGSIAAISNVVKVPNCNSLQVSPASTGAVTISLPATSLFGTVSLVRDTVRYLFHSLVLCANATTVFTTLSSNYGSANPRASTCVPNEFTACRSNVLTLNEGSGLPSVQYAGSDISASISITIEGHGGFPIYITYPALIDADAWRFNSHMRSVARYMPTMYRDIDEVQEPEYTLFKLIDSLSWAAGDAMDVYGRWFRFEPADLPSSAEESEIWVRSSLTDGSIARSNTLPWMANIVGSPLVSETYAVDPTSTETVGWQRSSYPLDMYNLLTADVVSTEPLSIENDLVIVPKWSEVVTASTQNVDISSALINGETIGGHIVATGDRVLLKHQSTASENGIYLVASSGAASRSTDADESTEFENGKSVKITHGSYANTYWAANISGSFTVDVDGVTFSENNFPGVIDGEDLTNGERVLLTNQRLPWENGLYEVTTSGAVRDTDLSTSASLKDKTYFEVLSGAEKSSTLWTLIVERPLIIDTDPLLIIEVDRLLDFKRSQISTAMYGHAAASSSSIRKAAQRLLTGNRSVAISPNSPQDFYISVKTIIGETPGVDEAESWQACRVATTTNIVPLNGIIAGAEIDGVTLALNDRVLVWQQANENDNGIYVAGSSTTSRATDADQVSEFIVGKVAYVTEGTLRANTFFALAQAPTTIGSTPILFEQAQTLGSSDAILQAIEPSRPIGFKFVHQTVNKLAFTFNSPSLGRLNQGVLR